MRPGLLAVVRKEVLQVTRDRRMMPLLVIAPVLQLVVFGYAVDFDVDHLKTLVCDQDHRAPSRAWTRRLLADGSFRDASEEDRCRAPEEAIRRGEADVALVLPPGLSRDLARDRPVSFQILADGTNPLDGRFARQVALGAAEALEADARSARLEALRGTTGIDPTPPRIDLSLRVLYNPALKSRVFMVPGVAAMILLVVTTVVMSMNLARERELGTLEQVLVTPLRRWELLLGKVLPFIALGAVDVLLILTMGALIFGVPIRGSLSLLVTGTFLYILSTVGIGIFLSVLARNQQQAFLMAFGVIMPGILLSGVMTPIENMPVWLQPLTALNPIRYYVTMLRAVLLKGARLADVWRELAAMGLFGVVILAAAMARFRKRLG
ncbi:MAG TPA: ABC transporter permease [Myxococcota bacterium]|nr:ABC transporter permease [Myxococcota bacterium]HQK49755.1 ABC transporter permease [Myxococcota bacterium]